MCKCKNFLLILFLVLLCISSINIPFQNDTFFSIAVGKQIVNNGIDMYDHLTWHNNLYYTYSHWIFDIINYFLYSFAGFKAIYLMEITISSIICITLFTVLKKLNKNSTLISFFITAIAIKCGYSFLTARAQIISYLFFILEIYFIEKLLETNKKFYIVGLLIIPIIIANFHAAIWPLYFVFYLPYFAEALFKYFNKYRIKSYILKSKLKKEKSEEKKNLLKEQLNENQKLLENIKYNEDTKIYIKNRKYIKTLIIVFFIAIFTGLLTPIKDTPYTYIFKTMGGLSSKVIQELAPPFLLNFPGLFCFLLSFIVFIAFPKTKINLADLFMISGLFLMSLVARRSIAYLVFIGIIPLTRLIIDFIGDYKCKLLDEGYRGFMSYKSAKVFVFVFTIIIFGTAIFFNFSRNNLVDEYTYPIKACDYLLENVNTENMRLFNDFNYGSYIEFRGIPAFIDSRSEVYTKEYNDTNILEDTINISFRSKILY